MVFVGLKGFQRRVKRQTGNPEAESLGELGKRLQNQDRVICLIYNRSFMKNVHWT